ncbi:hypothetical protein M433DRAFT_141243 [Acidomyces richmondensis BFW]|nr:MAG: hypothetical protein FE78DRAFT_33101 [Acidomyces sp. 'richmondensis']KYG48214.1 hypothetical protein M433DRAFT_141243 [Acidomyces richmondensis BFW]
MQNIWSRVAQARGTPCCPHCLSTVSGVTRRATASATRRAPKFFTSSTLWYSSIFAAAATYDVEAKKRRREQWDQAIAEVKQELGDLAESSKVRMRIKDAGMDSQDMLGSDTADDLDEFQSLSDTPNWPTNTGAPLNVRHLPPQSIYATPYAKEKVKLKQWSPKKIETTMLALDLMQLQTFLVILSGYEGAWAKEISDSITAEYGKLILLSREELKAAVQAKKDDLHRIRNFDPNLTNWSRSANDVALSNYHQIDLSANNQTIQDLNKSLQKLFRRHRKRDLSTSLLLAKMAYNLHASPAPPDVNTFNTMLLGLSKIHQPSLMSTLIAAMLHIHVRPNEITLSAILNYHIIENDAKSFVAYLERMRGKRGGLMLARPDIGINETCQARLKVKEGHNIDSSHRKVIQLPYPTPDVFRVIIKGVLKFSGFETALGICEGMGREGWGLCMSGLTPLLVDCANRRDWASGLAVWRQILELERQSARRRVHHEGAGYLERIPLETYAAMLRLCIRSGNDAKFRDVWQSAVLAYPKKAALLKKVILRQNADARPLQSSQPHVMPSAELLHSDAPSQEDTADSIVNDAEFIHDATEDDMRSRCDELESHQNNVIFADTTASQQLGETNLCDNGPERPRILGKTSPDWTDYQPVAPKAASMTREIQHAGRETGATLRRSGNLLPNRHIANDREILTRLSAVSA